MKKLIFLVLTMGILFSQERIKEIKLEKNENVVKFFATAQKIEGNIIDFGEDGKITLQKTTGIQENKSREFITDTLGTPISLNQIQFPALLEIEAIVKGGPYEFIPDIIKNVKRVIKITYYGKAKKKK